MSEFNVNAYRKEVATQAENIKAFPGSSIPYLLALLKNTEVKNFLEKNDIDSGTLSASLLDWSSYELTMNREIADSRNQSANLFGRMIGSNFENSSDQWKNDPDEDLDENPDYKWKGSARIEYYIHIALDSVRLDSDKSLPLEIFAEIVNGLSQKPDIVRRLGIDRTMFLKSGIGRSEDQEEDPEEEPMQSIIKIAFDQKTLSSMERLTAAFEKLAGVEPAQASHDSAPPSPKV